MIAIVDYGMGNLRSVEKALEKVGADPQVTSDEEAIVAADGLILPGVGAFPKAMERIRELELDRMLREAVDRDKDGIDDVVLRVDLEGVAARLAFSSRRRNSAA